MKLSYYIFGVLAAILLASCSTSRKTSQQNAQTETVTPQGPWHSGDCVTARSNVNVRSGKTDISLGGTLRMKRDDVIQLNLTYTMVITIQVGTLELRSDSALIVSRYTKQYAIVSYPELSRLIGHQVTFQDIQKFFWGEAGSITTGPVILKYGNMETIGEGQQLPKQVSIQMDGAKNKAALDIELSDFNKESSWQTRTEFSRSKYSRVSLDQVVKSLKV